MTVPISTCCGNKGNFTAPVIRFNSVGKPPVELTEKLVKIKSREESPEKLVSKPPKVTKMPTKEPQQHHQHHHHHHHHKRRLSEKLDHSSPVKLNHDSRRLANSHPITQKIHVSNNSNYFDSQEYACQKLAKEMFVQSFLKEYLEGKQRTKKPYRARSEPNQCSRQHFNNYYFSNNQCSTNYQTSFYTS